MFAKRFLNQDRFDSYDDYVQNAAPVVPDNFNFAYDVVDVIANETPDKIAIIWVNDAGEKKLITFKMLAQWSNAVANFLTQRGIKRGDTVMLFMRRRWEYWVLMMAMHKMGAIPIPSTNQLKNKDIKFRLDAADVHTVIAFDDGNVLNEIRLAIGDNEGIQIISADDVAQACESGQNTFERVPNENSDTMVVYFTSGTTDMPKMVAHNFAYPLGHINTAVFWQRLVPGDIHFTLSESGWAKCSWGKMYGQWLAGATVFVFDFSRVFTAHDLLTAISENKITSFCAPPTAYKMMIHADMARYDLSSLVKADVAGEALNPDVYERFFEYTGIKLREGFGQTETCVLLFNNQWIEPKPGSMGMPAAGWNIKLVDERGREILEPDTVGEICVQVKDKKPLGLFQGYHKNEKQTAAVCRDGYYHTGDMAYRDADGYFWFVGRNDDLIKTSGYRVSPFEVESVLTEHPAVREVAVTGVPDPARGMAVKATIVLNKYFVPSDVLVRQLQDFARTRAAHYKCPRVIEFVDSLPLTISGKIRRALIRTLDSARDGVKETIIEPIINTLDSAKDTVKESIIEPIINTLDSAKDTVKESIIEPIKTSIGLGKDEEKK
ncbi:MAG: acetyl-CoA synthetase [Alphaproteobacteria bacterium]|nr:acetyl-CoA synthetase [Alphaproteobacteria bacterium]